MRLVLVLLCSLACVGVAGATRATLPSGPAPTPPTPSLSAPVFVLTGGGYGHGVGLNQYGALGQARANRSYSDILAFYYPGTTLAKASVTKVRVLVAEGRRSIKIGSTAPFSVRDGSGVVTELPAGEMAFGPGLRLLVDGRRTPFPGPLSFVPGKGAMIEVDGKSYRGEIRVTLVGNVLQVIDVLGLDAYLLGVVPGEMPKEWPAAALQAQAVAARSYALASIVKNRPFDLYSDPRSQMYYGVAAESPATTAAVKATRSEILTYGGKVATTFYYSSSGGRTASSEDVFGIVTPYLQARDDPWDTLSPYHRWPPRSYTAASLGQAFGLSAPVVDVEVVPTTSGRPASVTLVKKTGPRILLRAADVRARLGLRSTAFGSACSGLPVLRQRPCRRARCRERVGARRRRPAPREARCRTARGSRRSRSSPADDGSFGVTVRPKVTATYRLTADGQVGPGADDHRRGRGPELSRAGPAASPACCSLSVLRSRSALGRAVHGDAGLLRGRLAGCRPGCARATPARPRATGIVDLAPIPGLRRSGA